MEDDPAYRARTRYVAYEELDDELVVLNLDTGVYGTIQGSGVALWQALVDGATEAELLAGLEVAYGVRAEHVAADLRTFLDELVTHELAGEAVLESGRPAVELSGTAYAPPRLEVFDDMQDLLALDPVHDVDRRGWPHAAG